MNDKTIKPCHKDWSHAGHFTGALKDNTFCEGIDKMVEVPEELIEDIHYRLSRYDKGGYKTDEARHLTELHNLVSDLSSYHTGRNERNGMMPWEFEED